MIVVVGKIVHLHVYVYVIMAVVTTCMVYTFVIKNIQFRNTVKLQEPVFVSKEGYFKLCPTILVFVSQKALS